GPRPATRVGVARAEWVLFPAPALSAAAALATGLVSRVVPHAEFAARLRETTDWLRQTAPGARAALKRDINRHLPPIDDAMFAEGLASDECHEGFRAFIEKRPPAWARKPGWRGAMRPPRPPDDRGPPQSTGWGRSRTRSSRSTAPRR